MIFNNKEILNTPALQVLCAVKDGKNPSNYAEHYYLLVNRLFALYQVSEAQEGRDATCAMISEFLGPDGLTECASMDGAEIVETAILESSPGSALCADLRARWRDTHGKFIRSVMLNEIAEYEAVTLRSWLETLVAEYLDI